MTHRLIAQSLNFRGEASTQDLPYAKSNAGTAISGLLTAIMGLAVLAVLILLVTAAFEWITSGGEKGKVESARNKIVNAIIGLVVLASVLVILILVQNFLNIHLFDIGSAAPTGHPFQTGIPSGTSF